MRNKIRRIAVWGLVWPVIVSLVFSGCGKKGPPAAPGQAAMAAVTDLTAVYGDGRIRLNWNHPGTPSPAVGYVVLQSRRDSSQPDCPGCPLVFERLGTVSMQRSLRQQRHALDFGTIASKDAVYHFKVIPTQSSGAQGPDSNLVRVEVK